MKGQIGNEKGKKERKRLTSISQQKTGERDKKQPETLRSMHLGQLTHKLAPASMIPKILLVNRRLGIRPWRA